MIEFQRGFDFENKIFTHLTAAVAGDNRGIGGRLGQLYVFGIAVFVFGKRQSIAFGVFADLL